MLYHVDNKFNELCSVKKWIFIKLIIINSNWLQFKVKLQANYNVFKLKHGIWVIDSSNERYQHSQIKPKSFEFMDPSVGFIK